MANASLILQLVERRGLVSKEQLHAVGQGSAYRDDEAVVDQLARKGFIDRGVAIELLAEEFAMPYVDLTAAQIPAKPSDLLEEPLARRFRAFPLGREGAALKLAISDPLEMELIDGLSHLINCPIIPSLADRRQIESSIDSAYSAEKDPLSPEAAAKEKQEALAEQQVKLSEAMPDPDDAPIIRLVQVIIAEAIRLRASDIHLEPMEARLRLRYRVDGTLQEAGNPPPKRLQLPIISRLKVMAKISIAEKRLPQDGRIQVRIENKDYDLRVSSLPTAYGESIVMRVLDKTGLMKGLPELGFLREDQDEFERLISLPDGILLVTGPTGSGKTTTLYSCLSYINRTDRKIITVEDPIEYQLAGVNQVPVKNEVGMTFAAALRAMLRQAPNIIMVGEIRDRETAEIAINASLTGHMVFSTLHTNDAPSAVTRLVDIGVKPYLVATSLRAALAQRLVRRTCASCGKPYLPTNRELHAIGLNPNALGRANFMKGAGCSDCYGTGVRGRFGLFELLIVNDELERMIYAGGTAAQLRSAAKQMGMRSMREDGVRKIVAGLTTVEEVLSATVADPSLV